MTAATSSWEIVTAVAAVIAAAGSLVAAVGVVAAFLSVRTGVAQIGEATRDRHVQVLGGLATRWADLPLEQARTLMVRYRSDGLRERIELYFANPGSDDEVEILLRVPNFYEDVAILVESGGLDFDLVWRAFAGPALGCWSYWEKAIALMQDHDAGAYVEYQRLVRMLRTRPLPSPERSATAEDDAQEAGQEMP